MKRTDLDDDLEGASSPRRPQRFPLAPSWREYWFVAGFAALVIALVVAAKVLL